MAFWGLGWAVVRLGSFTVQPPLHCWLLQHWRSVAIPSGPEGGRGLNRTPLPALTWPFCPQVGSWIGFAIMTQCLPVEPLAPSFSGVPLVPSVCSPLFLTSRFRPTVALFSLVGFTQMTIWAKGKHRSYLKEFRDYPPLHMPIIPLLL